MQLMDYAAAERDARSSRCYTCKLPADVLREIEAGRANGIPLTMIIRWLKQEHNLRFSIDSLRTHFQNGHHEKY